jgi:hypothetical protein
MRNIDKYLKDSEEEVNDISLTENDDELIEQDEYNEEVNDISLTDEDEEVNEIQLPRKRRVVGIIRRQPTYNTPREIMPAMMPAPAIMQEFYPQQQMYGRQPAPQKEMTIAQRVRQDIQYQMTYEKELRRAQAQNQPRESMPQKMLRVANKAAHGDGGAGAQISIKTKLYKNPNVVIPSSTTRFQSLDNLNNIIKKVSPKVSPKMPTVLTIKKKRR